MQMGKSPTWAKNGSPVQVWLEGDLKEKAKRCARIDRRSLQAFCTAAVEEKVTQMMEEELLDPGFVPEGLRKR